MKFISALLIFVSLQIQAEDAPAKSTAKPPPTACDPKKSVCEEANPETYKKFEAYQNHLDKKYEKYRQVRGDKLKAAGWKEIARCDDGHTWAYILEKSGDHLKCEGINGFAGPEEHPCVPFTDDLEKFKAHAEKAKVGAKDIITTGNMKEFAKQAARMAKRRENISCW